MHLMALSHYLIALSNKIDWIEHWVDDRNKKYIEKDVSDAKHIIAGAVAAIEAECNDPTPHLHGIEVLEDAMALCAKLYNDIKPIDAFNKSYTADLRNLGLELSHIIFYDSIYENTKRWSNEYAELAQKFYERCEKEEELEPYKKEADKLRELVKQIVLYYN